MTDSIDSSTPTHPDFKLTPFGWIPEEWELVKLGSIGKISSGTTPARNQHNRYFTDGLIRWVKTTDLNNSIIYKTEESVTSTALAETSLRIYPVGTILVAMYGGFNQIGRTGLLGIEATINQALSAVSLNDKAYSKYLLYWLNANIEEWKRFAGSSRKDPNITSRDVADFPVILPPLPEQHKIAAVLGAWDAAIEKMGQLLTALRQRHRALQQQLLTGQTRFPEFQGETWREVKLGDMFERVQRKNTSNISCEVMTISAKHGFMS